MAREWMTGAWLRVKALVKRRCLERDLEEELQFHLAKRAEKNRRLGLPATACSPPSIARRAVGAVDVHVRPAFLLGQLTPYGRAFPKYINSHSASSA